MAEVIQDKQSIKGKLEAFHVLLVDDSDTDREIAARYLKKAWPFEVQLVFDTAVGGAEALEKLRDNVYTLILLDWHMPRLSGGDVLRAMRKSQVQTPVVVLSSLQQREIPDKLEPLGAVYLSKDNLSPSSLREAISATSGLWQG